MESVNTISSTIEDLKPLPGVQNIDLESSITENLDEPVIVELKGFLSEEDQEGLTLGDAKDPSELIVLESNLTQIGPYALAGMNFKQIGYVVHDSKGSRVVPFEEAEQILAVRTQKTKEKPGDKPKNPYRQSFTPYPARHVRSIVEDQYRRLAA